MIPPHHSLEELGKVFVEVVDSQGRLVRRSTNLDNQSLPGEFPAGTYISGPWRHPRGTLLDRHQRPVRNGLVRVGESLELVERSLGRAWPGSSSWAF